jgi:S-adenosylmethionine synthetase
MIMGEITTQCYIEIPKIARDMVKEIGYTRAKYGFDGDTCSVLTAIDEQSPDIALGVNEALEVKSGENQDSASTVGAGDQGMVFGYATNETPEYMPMPIALAHRLARQLAYVRKKKILPFLRPDGKTQVTVEYDEERPIRVDTIVVSSQHNASIDRRTLEEGIREEVIKPVISEQFLDVNTKYLINPTGRFVVGGPQGDAGLTGRKIIVDTYGGMARHGGGAFSGKDPTKVDRSGAYAARYVAKNIVAAGLARKCELQIAYAIGVANPVSIMIDTFGTGVLPSTKLEELVREVFDLRPAAIIRNMDLCRPIYRQVASYGHFGRLDLDLPWERLDQIDLLRNKAEDKGILAET